MGNVILKTGSWSCLSVPLGLWGDSQGITRPEGLGFTFKEERIQNSTALQKNIPFVSLSILLKKIILTVNRVTIFMDVPFSITIKLNGLKEHKYTVMEV